MTMSFTFIIAKRGAALNRGRIPKTQVFRPRSDPIRHPERSPIEKLLSRVLQALQRLQLCRRLAASA